MGVVMKELFGDFKPGDKVPVPAQETELAEPPKKKKGKKKDPSELSDQLQHSSTTLQVSANQ